MAGENPSDKADVAASTVNDKADAATSNTNDKAAVAAASDNILMNIKEGILNLIGKCMTIFLYLHLTSTTVVAKGDVLKFKPNSFPWTLLAQIFGEQGLVMRGWPSSALMPGELQSKQSRAKGITTLKVNEQHNIYHTLENDEITIVKVEGKLQLSKSSLRSLSF